VGGVHREGNIWAKSAFAKLRSADASWIGRYNDAGTVFISQHITKIKRKAEKYVDTTGSNQSLRLATEKA
jgi:hypothetical protein